MRLSDPAGDGVTLDVSSVDQVVSPPSRGIMVESDGPVEFVWADSGRTVTWPFKGGVLYPYKVKRVNAAGTTATTVYIARG